jgi:hypothetical protein
MPPQTPSEPLQIGVGRAVPQAADAKAMAGLLSWITTANGNRRAAISVRSPGAAALRLGLLVEQLPPSALLRVYAPGAAQADEVAGTEVLSAIQSILNAGDSSAQAHAHIYWLPLVEGDQAVLEIELPAGVDPASLKVSLPRISHRYVSMEQGLQKKIFFHMNNTGTLSCNVDAMCRPLNQDSQVYRAVGWMTITKEDGTTDDSGCSGTLVNDTKHDKTPYFLTAWHCVPDASRALTVEMAWNYRTPICGSSDYDRAAYRYQGGGADLLYINYKTDIALIRLKSKLPDNAYFAGWDANPLSSKVTLVYSFHHPNADLLKYSLGSIIDIYYPNFYSVAYSVGIAQHGSSGGAIFNDQEQILGVLHGMSPSEISEQTYCSDKVKGRPNNEVRGFYGRLDLAYQEKNDLAGHQDEMLSKWLAPN